MLVHLHRSFFVVLLLGSDNGHVPLRLRVSPHARGCFNPYQRVACMPQALRHAAGLPGNGFTIATRLYVVYNRMKSVINHIVQSKPASIHQVET
jgi:hypothetical protein